MDFWKHSSSGVASSISKAPLTLNFSNLVKEKTSAEQQDRATSDAIKKDVHVDLRELYFLILHFLSSGPCQRTFALFCDELLEHELLPRRYHAWYSRSAASSGDDSDDGVSLPLGYIKLVERYPHIEKDHLAKLLKQLLLQMASPLQGSIRGKPNAADVPTLLGSGSFSLLDCEVSSYKQAKPLLGHQRWPHMHADQVHGLSLREIGGGFAKHHRAPSIRSACYAIAKPSMVVQKMQNMKKIRGHRNAVYCAIFDRLGRYVITGSDDRLVKIWSMETAFCLASCRGHEGDITDLAVSSNNALVASASNDFVIRVWRLPDGVPISVLRGHTGAVTAIAFTPRVATPYQLLSSSDDGTCRIWDARYSHCHPRIYVPKPSDAVLGKNSGPSYNGPSSSNGLQCNQILCCAYNANGTVFVTGSSDTYARVWSACRSGADESEEPIHEMDVLSGHENDVNYVQFSGCAVTSKFSMSDALKEEHIPKFKNSWFSHDNIVTCSRDGSAIIWAPKSRRSHGKSMRWIKSYHLKVPPPPLPPQPPRGGPRQRILPTPRGVNMIVWSLDNRFVLAAIMDCRICVWNAGDGSLVHSLTGHTESSYVLDVHPFNPRIAMSAGYDGKTIIWDIWEGIPIKTYEIGRFKLVDGKFSPDGTSIVLSDDVGQVYLLNTGQGDSQKDAKYDQFFLGDYRPLIQDTSGSVLDQETQLPPYRRNMQDPLCDSSMIPYPEPYQTMFQKRRLGALGIEWRPSSIKFAVGPDFGLGQDYQMPPLEDLDRIIEPLPEFIDTIYWELDNEIVSDDNDSEYNVPEESSECEQVSVGYGSSSGPDSSEEDSDVDHSQRDGLRRSRRRKHKTKVESMTSSGKRVKKRNLGERDGSLSTKSGAKKLKIGPKMSKKKSHKAHLSRPQRTAARNAINMFSKITGTSTDGDDDDSEDDTSESDPGLQDSEDVDRYIQNVQEKCAKDPKIPLVDDKDVAKPPELPESQGGAGNRKKLVFKISLRDSKKLASPEGSKLNYGNRNDITNPSPIPDQEHRINTNSKVPGLSSTELDITDKEHSEKVEELKDQSESNKFRNDMAEIREISSANQSQELKEISPPKLTRLKITRKGILAEPRSPSKVETNGSVDDSSGFGRGIKPENTSYVEQNQALVIPERESSGRSIPLYDVQKREKLHETGAGLESFYDDSDENASEMGFSEAESDAIRRTRSMKMKATSREPNKPIRNFRIRHGQELAGTSNNFDNAALYEERMSSLKKISRSARNKGHYDKETTKLSWLLLSKHEEAYRYIPQQGDEVVYLRQGHQEYNEDLGSRKKVRLSSIKGSLHAVEHCKVESLEYSTCAGSGDGCCKLKLRFTDPESNVYGKSLDLTLPELINFPDFVVEKTRYDDAVSRNWMPNERCLVWWRNENGEDGKWWEGKIEYLKAKSSDFPDSPWERYHVRYEYEDNIPTPHSPWELYDLGILWKHPHIDHEIRDRLLSYFAELELECSVSRKDIYGFKKLNEASQKQDFINRFAVPLSPEIILSRLENDYYRSFEAVKHDIQVMMENAQSYFSGNADLSKRMRRLSDWYTTMLSELENI